MLPCGPSFWNWSGDSATCGVLFIPSVFMRADLASGLDGLSSVLLAAVEAG
jgi:hypothetical protein